MLALSSFSYRLCREMPRRLVARAVTRPSALTGQVEKIGYVSRHKLPVLQETGISRESDLDSLDDEVSASLERRKDIDIDQTLDEALRIVEHMDQNALSIHECLEGQTHNSHVDYSINDAEVKLSIVNMHRKKILKTAS